MTIEEAIQELRYPLKPRDDTGERSRFLDAIEMALDALRAQQEAEKNEPPVRCKDCVNWKPGETMGGIKPGQIERLGECKFIRGAFMATDFCSRAKRRPPEKERMKHEIT